MCGNCLLPIVWPVLFYRRNAPSAPPRARRAMLVETVLLSVVGLMLTFHAARTFPYGKGRRAWSALQARRAAPPSSVPQ